MIAPTKTESITLTPAAADIVREMFQQRNLDQTYALRVYVSGRTCSGMQYGMALDNHPGEKDACFESAGLKILVDEQSLQVMTGSVVDYIDDERGKGFLVENPNLLPACSCEGGTCGSNED